MTSIMLCETAAPLPTELIHRKDTSLTLYQCEARIKGQWFLSTKCIQEHYDFHHFTAPGGTVTAALKPSRHSPL